MQKLVAGIDDQLARGKKVGTAGVKSPADEITAPAQAARLVGGKQAIGKSAAYPQRIAGDSGGADLTT